ncbi:hypothetical protein ABZ260_14075 [Streptosporangium sp. NPDC006013]|uniref:hypothetical protein n=1 Tax=Streptosporangium sp. NPDC006013 TaxID=3155596 RepID=UPI0033AFE982
MPLQIENLSCMATKAWFNSKSQIEPGAGLFQSERRFQLWGYTVSHGQLLLRSTAGPDRQGRKHETTIEVLFKPINAAKIRDSYDGLVVRRATDQEADQVRAATPSIVFYDDDQVFMLESAGETDYVVSLAIGWHEDVLSSTRLSFFATIDPYEPKWSGSLTGGYDPGFTVASARELIEALAADPAAVSRPTMVIASRGSNRPGMAPEGVAPILVAPMAR